MTNAHVVAGTSETSVEVTRSGRTTELAADVIYYDPETDLAVLQVRRSLGRDALVFEPTPQKAGADSIVLGYPLDGPFTITPGASGRTSSSRPRHLRGRRGRPRRLHRPRPRPERQLRRTHDRHRGQGRRRRLRAAVDDQETGFVLTVDQVAPAVQKAMALGDNAEYVATGKCAL